MRGACFLSLVAAVHPCRQSERGGMKLFADDESCWSKIFDEEVLWKF